MGDTSTTKAAEPTSTLQKTQDRPWREREYAPRTLAETTLFRAAAGDDPRRSPQHLARVFERFPAPQQTAFLRQCQSQYGNAYVQRLVSSLNKRQPSVLRKEEEDDAIQTKSAPSLAGSFDAGADVETQVSLSKGSGSPLPDPVRAYMEPRFGADFSHVRVHSGSDALQMNQAVGAQAFTHGSDIYFGAGKSPTDLSLTAHELTHVVQQGGAGPLQTSRLEASSIPEMPHGVQRYAGIQFGLNIAKPELPAVNTSFSKEFTATVSAESAGMPVLAPPVPPPTVSNGTSLPAVGKIDLGNKAPVIEAATASTIGKEKDQEVQSEAETDAGSSEAASLSTNASPAQEQPSRSTSEAVPAEEASPQAEAAPSAVSAKAPAKPAAESAGTPAEKAKKGSVKDKGGAEGSEVGEGAPEAAAPPSPREAIAPTIGAVRHRSRGARYHSKSAAEPVASAQAAAKIPQTEKTRTAAELTVSNLGAAADQSEAKKKDFKSQFKEKLEEKIAEATRLPEPKTESAANRVMNQGAQTASAALQGQLVTQSAAVTGPLKSASAPASEVSVGQVEVDPTQATLKPEPLGSPPAPVSAAPVVPAPLPPERLDYSSDREPADQAMAENNVTREQLEKGNEPEFGSTLEARSTAEQHEATVETRYRQSEAQIQGHGQSVAQATLGSDLAGMHSTRAQQILQVVGKQIGTQTKDQIERQRITTEVNRIKKETRDAVAVILTEMENEASEIFKEGLEKAEKAYAQTFKEEKGGAWNWVTNWGDDWKELIETSLDKAREEYLRVVRVAIDKVANCVETKLAAAKKRVADGLETVRTFVRGLHESVQEFGAEALKGVETDFKALEAEIDQHRDSLVDKLTQQYKASYERMSAMEEKLREENKSLWEKVYDATVGAVKKILAFKDMLLSILAGAAGIILDIISDPIGFLGNLVSGIKQGLENFMGKIETHLQKGLMGWLLGALAATGLQLPDKFDLQGILSLVLQILGLTYAKFRARAVALVGEPVVAKLEETAEVFKVFLSEGVSGLWRFIKEQLSNLKSMVFDTIFGFIKERVIIAGITWLIGLLNPASAFFKACKAIYDIVVFFINRGSQIMALVNAVVDSVAAIAKGALSTAVGLVEGALAKTIPVAIGFLASLLGLGDPAAPVRETIEKARSPVDKAIDWVINLAVKGIKAAGKFVGGLFGGKSDKGKKVEQPDEKETPSEPVSSTQITGSKIEIGKTVNFTAGGHPHQLWVERRGTKPMLMVASARAELENFLKSATVTAAFTDPDERAYVVGRAQSLAAAAVRDAASAIALIEQVQMANVADAEKKLAEARSKDENVEQTEITIVEILTIIFGRLGAAGANEEKLLRLRLRVTKLQESTNKVLIAIQRSSGLKGMQHVVQDILTKTKEFDAYRDDPEFLQLEDEIKAEEDKLAPIESLIELTQRIQQLRKRTTLVKDQVEQDSRAANLREEVVDISTKVDTYYGQVNNPEALHGQEGAIQKLENLLTEFERKLPTGPPPAEDWDLDQTIRSQLASQPGQIAALERNPNIKGISAKDILDLTPRQLMDKEDRGEIPPGMVHTVHKHFEGRDLRH